MKYCQTCSSKVLDTLRFCPKCGNNVFGSTAPANSGPTGTPFLKPNGPPKNTGLPLQGNGTSGLMSLTPIVIILAIFFIYPILNEQSNSACHAVEKKAISIVAMETKAENRFQTLFGGAILAEITNGEIASHYIKQIYPTIPPFVGCSYAYWRLLIDKNFIVKLLQPIQSGTTL